MSQAAQQAVIRLLSIQTISSRLIYCTPCIAHRGTTVHMTVYSTDGPLPTPSHIAANILMICHQLLPGRRRSAID